MTLIKELKSNPYRVVDMKLVKDDEEFVIHTSKGLKIEIEPMSIKNSNRQSTGSSVVDERKTGRLCKW